jgi:hypothetical protein
MSIVLSAVTETDIAKYGQRLFTHYRDQATSFEDAAQKALQDIYQTFQQADGQPLFGLVRVFRFGVYTELNSELQAQASADVEHWLALMGTYGAEAAWCDRRQSQGHRAIPANAPVTPMLRAAFAQIGLKFGEALAQKQHGVQLQRLEDSYTKYFHVPQALGSDVIPAQTEFVIPYGIASAVGLGSVFMGGAQYMFLGFAKAPISVEDANKFAYLAPSLSTLLAYFNNKQLLWTQAA